jgi:hypothetical protein
VAEDSQASSQAPSLVGDWLKVAGGPGTEIYPEHLHFAEGSYLGHRGASQAGMLWWDAGTYRLESEGDLVLSTANDEIVHYEVQLDAGRLRILDRDGRETVYERA